MNRLKPRFTWPRSVAALLLLLATRQTALAFVATGSVGMIDYRVMAPDWICRGEVVSLLIVVTAGDAGAAEQEFVASLTPPESGFDAAPATARERRNHTTCREAERIGEHRRNDADAPGVAAVD